METIATIAMALPPRSPPKIRWLRRRTGWSSWRAVELAIIPKSASVAIR